MLQNLDKKQPNLQLQVDKIVIGTLVCAMITDDCKYKKGYYPHLKVNAVGSCMVGGWLLVPDNDQIGTLRDDLVNFNRIRVISSKHLFPTNPEANTFIYKKVIN